MKTSINNSCAKSINANIMLLYTKDFIIERKVLVWYLLVTYVRVEDRNKNCLC